MAGVFSAGTQIHTSHNGLNAPPVGPEPVPADPDARVRDASPQIPVENDDPHEHAAVEAGLELLRRHLPPMQPLALAGDEVPVVPLRVVKPERRRRQQLGEALAAEDLLEALVRGARVGDRGAPLQVGAPEPPPGAPPVAGTGYTLVDFERGTPIASRNDVMRRQRYGSTLARRNVST